MSSTQAHAPFFMRYPDVAEWLCPRTVVWLCPRAVAFDGRVVRFEESNQGSDESEIELVEVQFVGAPGNVEEVDMRTGLPFGLSQAQFDARNDGYRARKRQGR